MNTQNINQAAIDFINAIASNMPEFNKPLSTILDVLNDGYALESLGVTDDDQEMVEEAASIVEEWIESGKSFL